MKPYNDPSACSGATSIDDGRKPSMMTSQLAA
jgi:hypothetical protein